MNKNIKVTVIGGGTGTYTVLSGIKGNKNFDIKAIVTVTDSGGSSGRLRDEYGILPVGDIRQCLVALSDEENGNNLLRKLFLYRFDRGDMNGHSFGNLFLTAMTDILGSEEKAISYASKVLNIRGEVIPVTNRDIDLVAEYDDGTVQVGEASIDSPPAKHNSHSRITHLKIQPYARISAKARDAITSADALVLGPGDLYTSLLSNVIVGGAKSAFMSSKGLFIYILNIMTKYGQTSSYKASDHVKEIISYTGREPDVILVNKALISQSILDLYVKENAYPVVDDLDGKFRAKIVKRNFISEKAISPVRGDRIKRSLIRHDSKKIAKAIKDVIAMMKKRSQ